MNAGEAKNIIGMASRFGDLFQRYIVCNGDDRMKAFEESPKEDTPQAQVYCDGWRDGFAAAVHSMQINVAEINVNHLYEAYSGKD